MITAYGSSITTEEHFLRLPLYIPEMGYSNRVMVRLSRWMKRFYPLLRPVLTIVFIFATFGLIGLLWGPLIEIARNIADVPVDHHRHPWPSATRRGIINRDVVNGVERSPSSSARHMFNPPSHSPHEELISPSRKTPRVVVLPSSPLGNYLRAGGGALKPTRYKQWESLKCCSVSLDPPTIDESWFASNAARHHGYKDPSNSCEPMQDWQLGGYQNCNSFHEQDYHTMRFINKGDSRMAFELCDRFATPGDASDTAKFVYKNIKQGRKITERKLDEQRNDALIMERASSSPFIANVHGYCGLGVMMDYMPEGNLKDYTIGARLAGGTLLSAVDKLRIAIHISSGVADLHTIALFFHNDIFESQFLFQDGIFKLNDFNEGGPLYVNTTNNEPCTRNKYESDSYISKERSLEEFQRLAKYGGYIAPEPTKVDVWMMGNVIYTLLTDLFIFEKPENLGLIKAAQEMLEGRRSPIPEEILGSDDPSYMAIRKALDMCWTYKWQERPSAREVSSYLLGQLKNITGEEDPDLRVKLPKQD